MQTKLKIFFLTVVNYPLGGNADKYANAVDGLRTPGPYRVWAKTVCGVLGQPIEDWILTAFESPREMLVSILDSEIRGKHLSTSVSFEDFEKIKRAANRCVPQQEQCGIESGAKIGRVEQMLYPGSSFINFGASNDDLMTISRCMVFNGILGLASYFLMKVLADSQKLKIKRCPYCKLFFPAKDTKRKICYKTTCNNAYHKEDMQSRRDKNPVQYCR